VCNRLPGAAFSVQFGEFGKTLLALERGKADDDSPKMRKVDISDNFSDSLEKPLAKRRKSVYAEHRIFCLWFGYFVCGSDILSVVRFPKGVIFLTPNRRIIAKCPCFMQYQFPKSGNVYSLSTSVNALDHEKTMSVVTGDGLMFLYTWKNNAWTLVQ